jgi:hypothetical protein
VCVRESSPGVTRCLCADGIILLPDERLFQGSHPRRDTYGVDPILVSKAKTFSTTKILQPANITTKSDTYGHHINLCHIPSPWIHCVNRFTRTYIRT